MKKEKIENYPTLEFMDAQGLLPIFEDCDDLVYRVTCLSEYPLKWYHQKIMKMPLSQYDRIGVKGAIIRNCLKEWQMIRDAGNEIVTDEEYRQINWNAFIWLLAKFAIGLMVAVVILMYTCYLQYR